MAVVPIARSLFLCDACTAASGSKIDVRGIFNQVHPLAGYPHVRNSFYVFAQLVNGIGRVDYFLDIRHVATNQLVCTTAPRGLEFATRFSIVNLAVRMESCEFPMPGLYLVQLFCDNSWVCDAELRLK